MTVGYKQLMYEGIIENVQVQMEKYICNDSFFVAPIGGVDVILGIKWLKTLEAYATNHTEDFIKFKQKGIIYKIYGIMATKGKVTQAQQQEVESTTTSLFSIIVSLKVQGSDDVEGWWEKAKIDYH